MEDILVSKGKKSASIKEKGKMLAYNLEFDIEVAIDVKKVLEERILNGKVEFTLGEVLRIVKREFHEVIKDIIKRKCQTLGDVDDSNTQVIHLKGDEDEMIDSYVRGIYEDVSKVRFFDEVEEATKVAQENSFFSHTLGKGNERDHGEGKGHQ